MASFNYVRLYAGPDGESHFEDVEVESTNTGRGTEVSSEQPATSFNFGEFRADYDLHQHTAPRRRMILMLRGAIEVEASDGEVRLLGPGAALLAEDTTGKGHKSRTVGPDERVSIYIQLPD